MPRYAVCEGTEAVPCSQSSGRHVRSPILSAVIGALALALGACGSSKPTAYVSRNAPTRGPYIAQPATLDFSVNGDLEAEHLKWTDWGQGVAIGHGTVLFHSDPSKAVAAVPGTVTLSEAKRCGGKLYYTAAVVQAPRAPFAPSPATFSSPC
jgi:hypothetical protein